MPLYKEVGKMYEERIALLRLAAKGRREYMKSAPEETGGVLEIQALALESAVKIMEGDMSPLFGLIPSWMWTDEMQADLERRLSE